MNHCQFKDQENNPCENPTPCTIQCRECSKDVCLEHTALGTKEWTNEPQYAETVLCIQCAYENENFERRAWIRQERRKAKRINTGEIIARGHLKALEGSK